MKTKILIIGLVAVVLSSCSDKEQSTAADTPKPLPTFDHATIAEVTPMSDGSAYATSGDSRLWYIRGNSAVRVTVTGHASQKLPEFSEITPAVDGSAYAIPQEPDTGLWHLRAEHIEKVIEAASLTNSETQTQISNKAYFALYLSEHQKRKKAEGQLEQLQNPPEPPDSDQ